MALGNTAHRPYERSRYFGGILLGRTSRAGIAGKHRSYSTKSGNYLRQDFCGWECFHASRIEIAARPLHADGAGRCAENQIQRDGLVPEQLTFERTRDWALIKSIVTHPAIYPHVSDDFAATPEEWKATQDEGIWYIAVYEGEEVLGLFILIPQNAICWDIHTCMLPKSYGNLAWNAGLGVLQWLWKNTPCKRVVTHVPDYNRVALSFAKRCGLVCYGINPNSYMKRGKLHNSILLGISKPSDARGELSQ